MGPFVIKDISSSGAIKVATLEGGEMPNWISGCRIKKYEEPRTQEMLQKIHNAKALEKEQKRVIKEAKDEAQVRILKRKQQQQRMRSQMVVQTLGVKIRNQRTTITEEDTYDEMYLEPLIRVQLAVQNVEIYALMDTGAKCNIISHELYDMLPKETIRVTESMDLQVANKSIVKTEFSVVLPVIIQGYEYRHKFHVMPYGQT